MNTRVVYEVLKDDSSSISVLKDCETAFNCRNIATKSQNYSVGATYFIKSTESAKSTLESLAQQIFHFHTNGLLFDPDTSGAEWWTQVIDHRDDIGFHWDRDYGSEEEQGLHIYPLFGTVTYLSNNGGPTLVLEKSGTPDVSVPIIGTVKKFVASKPLFGKSIAFDGSLLHAAPSSLTSDDSDSDGTNSNSDGCDDDDEEEEEGVVKRITFLVNIWINHIPTQCIRFPNKEVKKMQPFQPDLKLNFSKTPPEYSALTIALSSENCTISRKWEFNNSGINYEVIVPLPDVAHTEKLMADYDMLFFEYTSGPDNSCSEGASKREEVAAEKCIEIVYSEHQPSESGSEVSEDNGNSSGSEGDSSDEGSGDSDAEGEQQSVGGSEGSGVDGGDNNSGSAENEDDDGAESSDDSEQNAAKKRKL